MPQQGALHLCHSTEQLLAKPGAAPLQYRMRNPHQRLTMPETSLRPSHCQNCGIEMLGDHCWRCGQPVKGLVRHFSSIVGDFFDSVFDLDARVPRTLGPLLLRPGYLSLQYFAGHRVSYVSPVRLFVFLCIISFFLLKFAFDGDMQREKGELEQAMTVAEVEAVRDRRLSVLQKTLQNLRDERGRQAIESGVASFERRANQRIDWLKARELALANGLTPPAEPQEKPDIRFGTVEEWHPTDNPLRFEAMPDWFNQMINGWIERGQNNIARIQQEPGLLKDAFLENLPQTFVVLLPLFALLLKLFYLFKRRLYMEHLIVALHGHAFLCLAVLALAGLEAAATWLGEDSALTSACRLLEVLVWIWMGVYLWLSQKRIYGQGVLMTTLKFALIGLCYLALLATGVSISFLISVVTL